MYRFGTTIYDKDQADTWFLHNMLKIIFSRPTFEWLMVRRVQAAYFYYTAVSSLGGFRFNCVKGADNIDLSRKGVENG